MAASRAAPSSSAIVDFPAAVGPQMMRSLSPAKAALDLVPGEMNDRRATVDVVRREHCVAKRCEERPHLALRELLASLDGRFAGDGRRQPLVLGGGAGNAITGQ